MADGFIVRRGGKATEQALAPTITEVSVTQTSITFTIKNEDTEKAIIRYRIDDINAEGEIIELAGGATSSNITASGLDIGTEYIVFATANVTGKVKSNVTQLAIETESVIYTAATGGTTLEYNLDGKRYKSHTFTTDGNFVVTTVGNGDRNQVDYLIVAGGGGGGGPIGGGGGGGGILLDDTTVTQKTYGIIVGAGGNGGIGQETIDGVGKNGNNSTFDSTSSIGGGGGGAVTPVGSPLHNGVDGGSGGGGGSRNETKGTGGTGTSGQGNNGGNGGGSTFPDLGGGGGGGKNAAGANGSSNGGNGGAGISSSLNNSTNVYGSGGGGGSGRTGGTGGTNAGNGGSGSNSNGTNATANRGAGGGGGAGAASAGGNGSAGIVIIRYEIAPSV
jgi:hypothetical protein